MSNYIRCVTEDINRTNLNIKYIQDTVHFILGDKLALGNSLDRAISQT